MGGDIDGADANDGTTNGKEGTDDEESEQISPKFTAWAKFVTLPIDVFWCRHFLFFD